MFSDPLAVTYDGNAKSLPRVSAGTTGTRYRTADGEFEVRISNRPVPRDGNRVEITLARRLPDPTPSNVFDDYRAITNSFTLAYSFDSTRAEASVDIPKLRTALLALVDATFQSRLISGEK
jgi:hypothetical protein